MERVTGDAGVFESRTNRAWGREEKSPCMVIRIRTESGYLTQGKGRGSGIDSGRPRVYSSTRKNRGMKKKMKKVLLVFNIYFTIN